jgi:para-aminobenzoate synthetase/4-amino-4-deoxychorismate lyase
LCFELDHPAKLRLLLARGGATTLETSPLPAAPDGPVTCALVPLPVVVGDWRLRHKSTDRAFYEMALELAKDEGASEALLIRDDGLITEGAITSLFVERDGMLLTPPLRLGLLPGVLRASLIAEGKAKEAELRVADLTGGFLVGNAVRGLVSAKLLQS